MFVLLTLVNPLANESLFWFNQYIVSLRLAFMEKAIE